MGVTWPENSIRCCRFLSDLRILHTEIFSLFINELGDCWTLLDSVTKAGLEVPLAKMKFPLLNAPIVKDLWPS